MVEWAFVAAVGRAKCLLYGGRDGPTRAGGGAGRQALFFLAAKVR